MTSSAAFQTIAAFRNFLLAGSAIFTIVSKRTGARKTYKVSAKKGGEGFFFVSLLTGSNNVEDYTYLGALFVKKSGPASDFATHPTLGWKLNKQGWGTEAAEGFEYIIRHLNGQTDHDLFERAEVYHEGRCGKCGRTLTTPESVSSGLGPTCAGRE